jgi:hypothetical protein
MYLCSNILKYQYDLSRTDCAGGHTRRCDGIVGAVIQPGGSIRDEEVIKAADDAGIAMVFTGVRHFKH